ncbi:MAG: alpha/beta fold hydrolase [Myxococcales bacterium]|nr:alpha/beta fold hydrolase [Myxococcales bacterium]
MKLAPALAAFTALLLALLLAGCPRFHSGALPGAPADATFVDVDGIHVRYREAGSGPAVVLIHGFSASSDSWLSVIPSLAVGHRVIAIDLKGFGWTSRPDGDYSPAAQAKLAWAVLDKLGVEDVAIVGHSWGSSVALEMATAHQDRVRRVALYDAYVYDDQVPSFFRWAEKPGLGDALFGLYYTERMEDRVPLAYYDDRWVTQARVDHVESELDRPGTTAAALAAARHHHFGKLHEALRAFTRPVLLLWGENDEVTPLRFGQRLAAELADAELKVYPRCGHLPMVEAHNPSTRDLVAFLAKDSTSDTTTPAPTPSPNKDPHGEPGSTGSSGDGGSDGGGNPGGGRGNGSGGGGGADGGGGRGAGGGPRSLTIDEGAAGGGSGSLTTPLTLTPPAAAPSPFELPIGADLAALGAELTPRRYAAAREHTQVVIHGALRLREAGLFNLDLDRGLDSRGQPVFPVPLGGGQKLDTGDVRARTDLAVYAPGVGVAVKARVDWLDNVALGGDPELSNGSPATSYGQRPTQVVVKRAWGEVLTPFGILAAGRMGSQFGLGITANSGDCDDCDRGDAADRVAFVSPLFGHLLAVAWDVTSRGPFTRSRDGGHAIALEPTDGVSGLTLAVLRTHSPAALARRAAAGRITVEYGAYLAHRSQDRDVPASYLPTATPPATFTADDLVARGFSATTTGGWLRITNAAVRIEAELAYAHARIEQPSLIPGTEISIPVTSDQLGFALQTEWLLGASSLGLDGGYASGDSAPGFGAFPKIGEAAPLPGAFDGPQANLPRDHTVDNFRFNPDFRIDQILFREIIGTVTDAIYVRPHVKTTLLSAGTGKFEAIAALIASWAVEATSTPSGARALGVELDPELRFTSRDGFAISLAYGLLLPGAAFDNTTLDATAAHAVRGRIWFVF